jgi:hypothetical protein
MDRYTPELSRQCTHLVTTQQDAAAQTPSTKLAMAAHNALKWQTHIVDVAWAFSCAAAGTRLSEADFSVPAISAAAAAEVTARVMAAARAAADGKCEGPAVASSSASIGGAKLRLPLRTLQEQTAKRRSMPPPSARPPSAKVRSI